MVLRATIALRTFVNPRKFRTFEIALSDVRDRNQNPGPNWQVELSTE